MDKKTFSNEDIIERINEKYVPIKFNPEKPGKYITGGDTLSGRQLLLALSNNKPSGYPTFFLLCSAGKTNVSSSRIPRCCQIQPNPR
jgi:hypothetical protein